MRRVDENMCMTVTLTCLTKELKRRKEKIACGGSEQTQDALFLFFFSSTQRAHPASRAGAPDGRGLRAGNQLSGIKHVLRWRVACSLKRCGSVQQIHSGELPRWLDTSQITGLVSKFNHSHLMLPTQSWRKKQPAACLKRANKMLIFKMLPFLLCRLEGA